VDDELDSEDWTYRQASGMTVIRCARASGLETPSQDTKLSQRISRKCVEKLAHYFDPACVRWIHGVWMGTGAGKRRHFVTSTGGEIDCAAL